METASDLLSILVIITSFFIFMQQFRVLSLLGDVNTYLPFSERPKEINDFHFWVQIEVYFAFGIVCANSLFLMLRFFMREKMIVIPKIFEYNKLHDLDVDERDTILKKMRENTDYMKAAQYWITLYVIYASPMFINAGI